MVDTDTSVMAMKAVSLVDRMKEEQGVHKCSLAKWKVDQVPVLRKKALLVPTTGNKNVLTSLLMKTLDNLVLTHLRTYQLKAFCPRTILPCTSFSE